MFEERWQLESDVSVGVCCSYSETVLKSVARMRLVKTEYPIVCV
jgi:hypothetical protein